MLEITEATRFIIDQNLIGPGLQVISAVEGADVVITQAAMVVTTGPDDAVVLNGPASAIEVQGFVSAGRDAVFLGSYQNGSSLHVTSTGDLYGGNAGASFQGAGELVNEGSIRGGIYGADLSVTFGIFAVQNSGVIVGGTAGLRFTDAIFGSSIEINNTGLIKGGSAAINARGSATVSLVNQGQIVGDVHLGSRDDLFDNRAGQWTGSRIDGGWGSDTYMPGAGVEIILESAEFGGRDTLDFSGSAGLRVSLADGSGTGWAAGDTYAGIERVIGSEAGADTLIGDGLANTLEGRGGSDVLQGGDGADRLVGGLGIERLTGGAGDDAFRFNSLSERGDVILDFGSVSGSDDRIEIVATAFGFAAGPPEGRLLDQQCFVTSNRNAALDADDRFILRTTDTTLWFDADGRGGAKPVMLADLQAGAVLTAGDILLV